MGRRGPAPVEVVLSDDERETLERWARRPKSEQSLALRCRIVLECAEGLGNSEVAQRLGVDPATVAKWRGRFAPTGWRDCMTSLARARRASSVTTTSRPGRQDLDREARGMPRTGRPGTWPGRPA